MIRRLPELDKLDEFISVVSPFLNLEIIDDVPVILYDPQYTFVSLITEMPEPRRQELLSKKCINRKCANWFLYFSTCLVQGPYKLYE